MDNYGYDTAAMTNGYDFVIGKQRTRRTLVLVRTDCPPPVYHHGGRNVAEQVSRIDARRSWPGGQRGQQISWFEHGLARVLRLHDGTEIAVWMDETYVSAEDREAEHD